MFREKRTQIMILKPVNQRREKGDALCPNESKFLLHFSRNAHRFAASYQVTLPEQVVSYICHCLATWPKTQLPRSTSLLDKPARYCPGEQSI